MTGPDSGEHLAQLDQGERLVLLHRLLGDYPGAVVAALDAHGNPVAAPSSIRLSHKNEWRTGSPLEVVAPASRVRSSMPWCLPSSPASRQYRSPLSTDRRPRVT